MRFRCVPTGARETGGDAAADDAQQEQNEEEESSSRISRAAGASCAQAQELALEARQMDRKACKLTLTIGHVRARARRCWSQITGFSRVLRCDIV
jgi:hypothetical protein